MSQGFTKALPTPLPVNMGGTGTTTSTGSGSVVLSNSPALVTPNLGVATATSLAFSPTTNGIVGTATNDSAGAGYVGQIISSTVLSGSAISLTTATAANVTFIDIPAGQWSIIGNVYVAVAGGGSASDIAAWASETSASIPDQAVRSEIYIPAGGMGSAGLVIPPNELQLASTTRFYLTVYAAFTGSATASGRIVATRSR